MNIPQFETLSTREIRAVRLQAEAMRSQAIARGLKSLGTGLMSLLRRIPHLAPSCARPLHHH